MADILEEWINDANAYELLNIYRIEQQVLYQFVNKSDDFYISLLNRMFFTMRNRELTLEDKKERLLRIVTGLLVYSEKTTAGNFDGVNRNNNLLYIAAIYYLCEYNALSQLFIWRAKGYEFENESAQLLYSIMAGSEKYANKENELCLLLKKYMLTGDEGALNVIDDRLREKIEHNIYLGLDDFFDTQVVVWVMKRFRESNLWKILIPHGGKEIWGEYIAYSVKNHIYTLLPSQEDAISKGLLDYTRSFSLKMPTSAGKTFLTELLVFQELKNNPDAKILYLAPLRSLSRELKERYGRLSYKFSFDFRAAYGGCTTSAEEETIENAKLLIATPETFTTLEGSIDDLTEGYTLVVCDEGQLLEDRSRGVNYELLLTRLKRNKHIRFLFISAIIPNISDINQWLGGTIGEVGNSTYRPCKIRFALATETDGHIIVQYANDAIDDWSVKVNDFLNDRQAKLVGTTQRSLSCALSLKAMEAGPVMLYCSMKDGPRGCIKHAEELLNMLSESVFKRPFSFVQDMNWLSKVAEYCTYQFGDDHRLTQCVKKGFAYHHGQMPQDMRELIETAIAKKSLQLVVCTKTLSEGINMPIKTAVLANITNPTDGTFKNTLELRDLKNIVGRVGRAGKESYGLILLPIKSKNTEPIERVIQVIKNEVNVERTNGALYYIVQQIRNSGLVTDEEINTFLESEGVAEQIDTLINLNKDDTELIDINLDNIIEDSLAYYLGDKETKKEVKKIFLEDEQRNAKCLIRLLNDIDRTFIVEGPLASIKETVEFFQSGKTTDLILADIRLTDGLSFEALKHAQATVPIIFTTAYDEYAVQAFKFNSFDYLLKPLDPDELEAAIDKAVKAGKNYTDENLQQLFDALQKSKFRYRERFLLPYRDGYKTVRVSDINHIETENKIVHLRLNNGTSEVVNVSMDELEHQLNPDYFFRANRQYIINVEHVLFLGNYFGGKLIVRLKGYPKTEIQVSKEKAQRLKEWIDR